MLMMEIQMRMLFEQEDRYWHAHFAQQPYYASGRSYDQYRPAFALGWVSALQMPELSYAQAERQLERDWDTGHGTSLLPWREVQVAVQDAWEHVRQQVPVTMVPQICGAMPNHEVRGWLRPLYMGCCSLADELQRLSGQVALNDFAAQVLERHIQMLLDFAQSLHGLLQVEQTTARPPWPQRMWQRWEQIRHSLSEVDPSSLFMLCEQREQMLLRHYEEVLAKPLPVAVRQMLEPQAKRLLNDMDKLRWVRKNWFLAAQE